MRVTQQMGVSRQLQENTKKSLVSSISALNLRSMINNTIYRKPQKEQGFEILSFIFDNFT
jgi:hypothetical protein